MLGININYIAGWCIFNNSDSNITMKLLVNSPSLGAIKDNGIDTNKINVPRVTFIFNR